MADVTERAAELVNEGDQVDPEDVDAILPEISERVEEIEVRLEAIASPKGNPSLSKVRGRGGVPGQHVYKGAGDAWREAAEAGDAAELARLEEERAELRQERSLLTRQRRQLVANRARSEQRIAEETAPERLEDALERFPEALAEAEAALEAFRAARDELDELGREIAGCREIVGDDADGLTPRLFRRWGLLETPTPGELGRQRVQPVAGRHHDRAHVFGNLKQMETKLDTLEAPSEAVLEATRRRLDEEGGTYLGYGERPIPDEKIQERIREERVRAIVAGEFERLHPDD